VEFTLVLTVVLGLCVGAVVADVLFGPEQPATSSSTSNGDQWDPWRRWWRQGREALGTFGIWLRKKGARGRAGVARGWEGLSRSFPARREQSAPNPEVLPPPVAPPLHEDRLPVPPPIAFVDTRPAPVLPEPVSPEPVLPDLRELAPPDDVDDLLPLLGPAGGGATTTGTALLERPAAAPVTITIPRAVRIRAGLGLLLYVALAGIGLAAVIVALVALGIKTLGGI